VIKTEPHAHHARTSQGARSRIPGVTTQIFIGLALGIVVLLLMLMTKS